MIKKKSKYRSVVINKKRYYFCKITWLDILGDSGHADIEEFNQMKPAEMVTHAYVYYNDSKLVKTFSTYDTEDEYFSGRNIFPRGCIKKLEKVLV